VTKVRFAFLTFVSWPGPGDESQICFSDFRHLAQARWRTSDLLFRLSSPGLGQVAKVRVAFLTFVIWPGPGDKVRFAFLTFVTWLRPFDESQICFSDFRYLAQAR
jgi:hypothetical protein